MITVGELFAGIGGIGLGLERTGGFEVKWQVERDEYASKVLAKHWPEVQRFNDVREFPPGDQNNYYVDLIAGGFPCQDISVAGKGEGLEGERSGLFYEIVRIAERLKPKYLLLENVAALLYRGVGDVLRELAQIGYSAEWHCIPAAAVGAPHRRDRLFIVAHTKRVRLPGSGKSKHTGNKAPYCEGETIESINGRFRDFWAVKPNVGRVANGVSGRVDRLRCLGNAVVPQVAQFIGEMILRGEQCKVS